MNSFLSPRMMVGAAIVGLVGAAGVFIYEQVYNEKRRAMLVSEMARLDKQVSSMRTELESLRALQKENQLRQKQRRRPRPKPKAVGDGDTVDAREQSCASDSEYFTDYQSVLGTDQELDSEEFYDVHTDDDDDTLRESLRNGHAHDLDEDSEKSDGRPADNSSNASTVTLTDKAPGGITKKVSDHRYLTPEPKARAINMRSGAFFTARGKLEYNCHVRDDTTVA